MGAVRVLGHGVGGGGDGRDSDGGWSRWTANAALAWALDELTPSNLTELQRWPGVPHMPDLGSVGDEGASVFTRGAWARWDRLRVQVHTKMPERGQSKWVRRWGTGRPASRGWIRAAGGCLRGWKRQSRRRKRAVAEKGG